MKYTARDYGKAARIVQAVLGPGMAAALLNKYRDLGIRFIDPDRRENGNNGVSADEEKTK